MGNEENKEQKELDKGQGYPPLLGFDDISTEEGKPPPKSSDAEDQSGLIPRDENIHCEKSSEEVASQETQAAKQGDGTKTAEMDSDDVTEPEEVVAQESVQESPVSVESQETVVADIPSAERTELFTRANEEYEQEKSEFNKSKKRFEECLEFETGFRS